MTRLLSVVLGITFAVSLSAQTKKIDWKPCTDVTDKFKSDIEKFNAEHHDGFQIMASCTYGGDPKRVHKPEQKIALTPAEIKHLHALRRIQNAAYSAGEEYETYLFRAHRIRKPDIGKPCYYYAGIKVDDDFITVDPNPMMATEDCP